MKMNFNKDTESPADDDLGIRGRRERDINKIANTIITLVSILLSVYINFIILLARYFLNEAMTEGPAALRSSALTV